jgi:hypothetical protein
MLLLRRHNNQVAANIAINKIKKDTYDSYLFVNNQALVSEKATYLLIIATKNNRYLLGTIFVNNKAH